VRVNNVREWIAGQRARGRGSKDIAAQLGISERSLEMLASGSLANNIGHLFDEPELLYAIYLDAVENKIKPPVPVAS
jgi:hypothetical protein